MKKKSWVYFSLITILLAATLLAFQPFERVKEKPSCCKEGMDQCPLKEKEAPGGMIWDNLSHQFFSFTSASY